MAFPCARNLPVSNLDKAGMPQVISARPFEELDLGHSLRLDPNAVPHSRLWALPKQRHQGTVRQR
jgi:hypothetical protein